MRSYRNYPIKCKTCGEPIAALAQQYESMVTQGLSIEEALNTLGIMNPCTRINMMDSPTLQFDLQDNQVVEGLKDVQSKEVYNYDRDAKITVSECLNRYMKETMEQTIGNQGVEAEISVRRQVRPAMLTRGQIPTRAVKEQEERAKLEKLEKLALTAEELGEAIPLTEEVEPTVIGVPVIAKVDTVYQPDMVVGPNLSVKVLAGRIFLCR
jgi:DNA-directed RNA polymerase subunit N (RpoN/RPB10)